MSVVPEHWRVSVPAGERLFGGEESAAYRVGEFVIRIGPSWRSDEELEWAHAVAARAAGELPEAVAPMPTASGATVVRVGGRPVSVWPFRAGAWPDDDSDLKDQAADLLARLHRSLRLSAPGPRPGPGPTFAPAPDLDDPDLDRWLQGFDETFNGRQPLHGDFYAGNVLVESDRLVALLDWDEAFIGPPERELAWAAWEWGDGLDTLNLEEALEFVDTYVAAGGVARHIDEVMLQQLVRERLRREVRYARAARLRGVAHDVGDFDYEARQLEAFIALRP